MKSAKTITLESPSMRIFFRQYVELLNPLLSISNKQMDTLGILLHQNYKLSRVFNNPEDPIKWHTLFSTKSRREMAGELGISLGNFNNNLQVLRDKKLVTFSDIREDLVVDPISDEFALQFKFKITKDEGSKAHQKQE